MADTDRPDGVDLVGERAPADDSDTEGRDTADPDAGTDAVTFHPQEWVDSPGESHDWDRRQLIPARERDAVISCPAGRRDRRHGDPVPGRVLRGEPVADHPVAPEWVRDWDGPYYVTVEN